MENSDLSLEFQDQMPELRVREVACSFYYQEISVALDRILSEFQFPFLSKKETSCSDIVGFFGGM